MNADHTIRILVIDDQESIHADFRKIIEAEREDDDLAQAAAALFGDAPAAVKSGDQFAVDSAHQGQEGLAMVVEALRQKRPYPLAFVDVRMPPGWDGVETIRRIWEVDPEMLIVLCTAYSDHTWEDIVRSLGRTDHMLILKKPFDNIEVQQLVVSLTRRWDLARQAELTRSELEEMVKRRTAEVEARRQDLESAIEELRTMNQQLSEANRKAVAADQAKTEFLANMSHEIRTPMTSILGYSQLLRDDVHDREASPEERAYVETIIRNAKHLLSLLNNVLDISKIESGKLEVERVGCSPFEVIDDAIGQMKPVAQAKGLDLTAECCGSLPQTIHTDPLRLRQILINLLGNAIKFTEQGYVRVTARLVKGPSAQPLLEFEVMDTGVGITPEQMSRLFQRFSQADGSTTRKHGGSGLGLAISRHLAKALGGDIVVHSEPGQGTTFVVTLETGDLGGIDVRNPLPPGETAPVILSGLPAPATGRILLAEDSPDNQRLIAFILRKAGWQVTTADNGKLACEAALAAREAAAPFDLILMDMHMPVLDGCQATRQLRSAGHQGPIVALTANSFAEDRESCFRAGCDFFVTKPIDRKHLLKIAADCMTQRRESPIPT